MKKANCLTNSDSFVTELYKKILETTLTPAGIDTAKLYPILMSSGLPRETLGQIWALANRTTPGKLTKEELYAVLAMIAVTQVWLWRLECKDSAKIVPLANPP